MKLIALFTGTILMVAVAANATIVATYQEVLNPPNNTARTYTTVPNPSAADYADQNSGNGVTMSVAAGTLHGVSGPVTKLNDGLRLSNSDDAANAVFFADGDAEERLLMDLRRTDGRLVRVSEINTYSWQATTRHDQVYSLYGSASALAPSATGNLLLNGWQLIATVDTIHDFANKQVGVSITESSGGPIGDYNFLLWDVAPWAGQGNVHTFYEEFDVFGVAVPEPSTAFLLFAGGLLLWRYRRRGR